jgi:integrase
VQRIGSPRIRKPRGPEAPEPDPASFGTPNMLLTDFHRDFCSRKQIDESTARNYRKHVRTLCEFAGTNLRLCDLNSHLVDRWLAGKLREGASSYTVVGYRSSIRSIWNDAFKLRLIERPPDLMRVRRPDLLVKTWTAEDVASLAAEARNVAGFFENISIPRGVYLATAIAATWYAGIRRKDLHLIRREQIRKDGTFALVQHKTGKRHVGRIPPEVLAEITRYHRRGGPLWPRPGCDNLITSRFRTLVLKVRQKRPGMFHGCWRDIRRSAENSAERLNPGRGHLLAGHERRTFEKYYQETNDAPAVSPDPLPPPDEASSS